MMLINNSNISRDFIYVDDIVDGLLACALKGEAGDVYNIASGVETSIFELASIINEMTGNSANVHDLPARSWDRSGKRHGNPEKSKNVLGFGAKVGLPEGLRRTIDWSKDNMHVIKQCIRSHERYVPELLSHLL